MEAGDLVTPDGAPYRGFKITIGGLTDPQSIQRTYDDIDKIFKANQMAYKITEHRKNGHFDSYSVSTD